MHNLVSRFTNPLAYLHTYVEINASSTCFSIASAQKVRELLIQGLSKRPGRNDRHNQSSSADVQSNTMAAAQANND